MKPQLRVMFTGGRDYNDYLTICQVIHKLERRFALFFIYGDCPTGLDFHIHTYVKRTGTPGKRCEADWSRGKVAGPIRNAVMVQHRPALCVEFPGGKGTADAVQQATLAGIKILTIKANHDSAQGIGQSAVEGQAGTVRDAAPDPA